MEERIRKLESNDEKISQILNTAGVSELAEVKQSFTKLAEENIILYKYCRTFYWTLLNYLEAYRALGTNLLTGNLNYDQSTKEKCFGIGLKRAAGIAKKIAEGMPLIGVAIGVVDATIDPILNTLKRRKLIQKTDAINKILSYNNDPNVILEDDISLICATTALNVSNLKKEEIEKWSEKSQKTLCTTLDSFKMKSKEVKEWILPSLQIKDSPSAELALQDVILLLLYMFVSYDEIIETKMALNKQFTNIIIEQKWNHLQKELE